MSSQLNDFQEGGNSDLSLTLVSNYEVTIVDRWNIWDNITFSWTMAGRSLIYKCNLLIISHFWLILNLWSACTTDIIANLVMQVFDMYTTFSTNVIFDDQSETAKWLQCCIYVKGDSARWPFCFSIVVRNFGVNRQSSEIAQKQMRGCVHMGR